MTQITCDAIDQRSQCDSAIGVKFSVVIDGNKRKRRLRVNSLAVEYIFSLRCPTTNNNNNNNHLAPHPHPIHTSNTLRDTHHQAL